MTTTVIIQLSALLPISALPPIILYTIYTVFTKFRHFVVTYTVFKYENQNLHKKLLEKTSEYQELRYFFVLVKYLLFGTLLYIYIKCQFVNDVKYWRHSTYRQILVWHDCRYFTGFKTSKIPTIWKYYFMYFHIIPCLYIVREVIERFYRVLFLHLFERV